MNSLEFVFPLVALSGIGALALVVVAIAQDLRQERKYGYRQAFFTIVSLAMLVFAVGSGIALLSIGLKESVFRDAKTYTERFNIPPAPYLSGPAEKPLQTGEVYRCETACQFTAADKQNFESWKTTYRQWQETNNNHVQLRRDLAGALSMFLIAWPLYFVFARMMNKGAKEERALHERPSPLRSVYYYGVAFAGLIVAVVGGAMFLNSILRTALKTEPVSTTPAIPTATLHETVAADSVINCAAQCGFSADDVALVRQWKEESATYRDRQNSNQGGLQNDMANSLPFVAFGIPLFWYHFTRIRKETQDQPPASEVAAA